MTPLDYVLASLRRAAENGYSWSVSPDEATALVAEVDRLRAEAAEWARLLIEAKKEGARSAVEAREAERAAVVAWLRDEVDAAMKMRAPVRAATFLQCAEAIERGEHRREETK